MNTHPFIIHASHKQSTTQRWTGWLLTLLFWALWSWLWWPYASRLLPDDLELLMFASKLPPAPATAASAGNLLMLHAGALLTVCAALVLWAVVHARRYGKTDRRQRAAAVSVADLSNQLGLAPVVLQRGRLLQRMVAHHHQCGGLKQVDSADTQHMQTDVWDGWHPKPLADVPAAHGSTAPAKDGLAAPA